MELEDSDSDGSVYDNGAVEDAAPAAGMENEADAPVDVGTVFAGAEGPEEDMTVYDTKTYSEFMRFYSNPTNMQACINLIFRNLTELSAEDLMRDGIIKPATVQCLREVMALLPVLGMHVTAPEEGPTTTMRSLGHRVLMYLMELRTSLVTHPKLAPFLDDFKHKNDILFL